MNNKLDRMIDVLSEIEDKNTEFYAIWDSANTSELFKNFQIVEEEKQQVKGILE